MSLFKTLRYGVAAVLLGLTCSLQAAPEVKPDIPSNDELNDFSRWTKSSSGADAAAWDDAEKAMRFSAKFKPDVDLWLYPQFRLLPQETLDGVRTLSFEIKTDVASLRSSYVILAPGQKIAYTAPTTAWQNITVKINPDTIKLNKVKTMAIGLNPLTPEATIWLRNIRFSPAGKPKPVDAAAAIKCTAPGNVFTAVQQPQFTLKDPPDKLRYSIHDFFGGEAFSGTWPADGQLTLPPMPIGYYTIKLDNPAFLGEKSFVVVVDPARRTLNPDSFFSLDTAQSWLARPDKKNTRFPGPGFDTVNELCRLAGLSMIRDRLSWSGVMKSADATPDWAQYRYNAEQLAARGIKVCGMFHDSPNWSRYPENQKSKNGQTNFPDDLLATYKFTRTLAQQFHGRMTVWEFWNEADHHNHAESPWDFAAATKAAYLGFKAGDPDLKFACGSFCQPLAGYSDIYLNNDAARYFDIYNYHIYNPLPHYPGLIQSIRDNLARFGVRNMPIYITENGTDAEGNATVAGYIPGINAHSVDQNRIVTEFIPKSQILLQSLGVARDFFFVLIAYNERDGQKDWGLLRRDYSAKPSYAAFANLTMQLGNARYLGLCDLGKNVRAFLYQQPDQTQTLAVWSISGLDLGTKIEISNSHPVKLELPVADGDYQVADIFGRTTAVKAANGKLPLTVTRYTSYINGLRGLKPTVPAADPTFNRPADDLDRTVILKPVFQDNFKIADARTSMILNRQTGKMRLEIFNLSEQAKTGRLNISGAQLPGVPAEITLPPMSKTAFETAFIPVLPTGKASWRLNITGTFNDKNTSALMVPLLSQDILDRATTTPINTADPQRWRANAASDMQITYDAAEKAIRFDIKFKNNSDRWIYPELPLLLPAESMKDAVGIKFAIKAAAPAGTPLKIGSAILMLVETTEKERGTAANQPFPAPTDKWEERMVMLDEFSHADKTRMLRVGMNPKVEQITYWVRDLRILQK